MRWYVDGMNVIGSRGDGWWKDRNAAMVRLVDSLERWAVTIVPDEVTVVFERRPTPAISSGTIEVAHAPRAYANAADDEIVRRLGNAGADAGPTTVVTSDRRLAERSRAAGAAIEPASAFRTMLETL